MWCALLRINDAFSSFSGNDQHCTTEQAQVTNNVQFARSESRYSLYTGRWRLGTPFVLDAGCHDETTPCIVDVCLASSIKKCSRNLSCHLRRSIPQVLNEQPVDRSPTAVGAEECKGTSDVKHVRVEDGVQGTDECITLYVTVISDGVSKVVPFHFSSADSMAQASGNFARCPQDGSITRPYTCDFGRRFCLS